MKTPEEIKKGLECCINGDCDSCPYHERKLDCGDNLNADAIALIEKIEDQIRDLTKKVPKWMNDDGSILCPYCGTTMRMIPAWQKSIPDMGGYMWAARGKCPACGSITPEMHGRTAKEANAAAYAAAQWGHMPQLEEHIRDIPKKVKAQSGTDMNVHTIDAEHVRHGRWELVREELYECSACGMIRNIRTQLAWIYCPKCGAKMDLEVEHD